MLVSWTKIFMQTKNYTNLRSIALREGILTCDAMVPVELSWSYDVQISYISDYYANSFDPPWRKLLFGAYFLEVGVLSHMIEHSGMLSLKCSRWWSKLHGRVSVNVDRGCSSRCTSSARMSASSPNLRRTTSRAVAMRILDRIGDSTHPCHIPWFTSNGFEHVSSLDRTHPFIPSWNSRTVSYTHLTLPTIA